jgi:hypothetical protein
MPLHYYYSMNITMVEEEKRRSTNVHTSDMIIGCALKGLRAPGLSTKQVQRLKCYSVLDSNV